MSQLTKSVTIDSLLQPEDGAVIVTICPSCGQIEIFWDSWAVKPKDGNVWKFHLPCSKLECCFAYRPFDEFLYA